MNERDFDKVIDWCKSNIDPDRYIIEDLPENEDSRGCEIWTWDEVGQKNVVFAVKIVRGKVVLISKRSVKH